MVKGPYTPNKHTELVSSLHMQNTYTITDKHKKIHTYTSVDSSNSKWGLVTSRVHPPLLKQTDK